MIKKNINSIDKTSVWSKGSWRNYPVKQQPEWEDEDKHSAVLAKLEKLPSLVFSGETRKLLQALGNINNRKNFLLQVGNCAESFSDCNGPKIHNFLRIFLQMAMIIEFNTDRNVIKIGRIAGQYAKPRSLNYEEVNGCKLPIYRGDNINSFSQTLEARTPKSEKLIEGYFHSTATLNLIRAFIQGGYNEISNINDWGEHYFSEEVSHLKYYGNLAASIKKAIQKKSKNLFSSIDEQIYISHEGLLLDFEEAFTRYDTTHGGFYDTSAHFIWVGERTRHPDEAHIEFIRGIGNPVGVKIGPNFKISDILKMINKINPNNIPGKLSLIIRFGHKAITKKFPQLISKIVEEGINVNWICDPMHGNTLLHNKYKVRYFDHIVEEIKLFFAICKNENIVPGGIHLEITDEYVTECIGGICGLAPSDISKNYSTKVDPRLNALQALEIAFIIGKLLKDE